MAIDGRNHAPTSITKPVVAPGEFGFAVIGMDHGHIYGMCQALVEAGAELLWAYDADAAKAKGLCERYGTARVARDEAEALSDPRVRLVACASVPGERSAVGLRAMDAGKDFFVDKAPMTTLEQLAQVRRAVVRTGRKYMVYYSERLHSESAVYAGHLIEQGAIGRVVQVMGTGPHRVGADRPDWFYDREGYGGILIDIGSHQIEQILHFTGASDAAIVHSQIANHAHPDTPDFDDYGEAALVTDNGASGYFRIDWLTPDGLQTWGDGRTFILGTQGYIELRKYCNVGTDEGPNHVFLVNGGREEHIRVDGTVGFPFFGALLRDCLDRTETAMTQEHALKAAELSIRAQLMARRVYPMDGYKR